MEDELRALREEVAALRQEIVHLRSTQVVHHYHHHQPNTLFPNGYPAQRPIYPGGPWPATAGPRIPLQGNEVTC